MANPLGLHFDGDLRRIYEVPENSSYSVDSDGYRVYVPDNVGTAEQEVIFSTTQLWSRFVDFHNLNKWSTLAFIKQGGGFRFTDQNGVDVYQTFDIRLINGWEVVPADYPHKLLIFGNLFGDQVTGRDFDDSRITSLGVSPRVFFSDSLQTAGIDSYLMTRILKLLEADERLEPGKAQLLDRTTKEVLLEKTVSGGDLVSTVELIDA